MLEPNKNSLVVVKLDEVAVRNESIVLADNFSNRFWKVKVIAFGKDVREITGIDVRLGDTLLCNPIPEIDREVFDPENKDHLLLAATQVHGRVL